jgi:putative transcription antitermination factor YqgF
MAILPSPFDLPMGRLLALDLGQTRSGAAVCDAEGTLATPLAVLRRHATRTEDYAEIATLIAREKAVGVLVGLPLASQGEEGSQARWVRRYAGRLAGALSVPVAFWDESYSSADADRLISEGGGRTSRDAAAAAVVLQAFLEARRADGRAVARIGIQAESMQDYIADLIRTVEEHGAWLVTVPDALAVRRPARGGWCIKEIIGHLIDSAANNHARFVRAQVTDDLACAGYDQDAWVAAQEYAGADWLTLVGLWRLYNLHLARVMAAVPDAVRMRPRANHTLDQIAWRPVAPTETVTLDYLMADYVGHLKSHLHQITSLLDEPTSGV